MKTTADNTEKTFNKREEKKNISFRGKSRLYFQVGLVVGLLSIFFIMETYTPVVKNKISKGATPIEDPAIFDYVIEPEKPKPVNPEKKVIEKKTETRIINKIKEIDNSATIIETPVAPTDTPTPVINPVINIVDTTPVVIPTKTMKTVEFVPVFPGCESVGNNEARIECMSSKINDFINRKFKKEILEGIGTNEIQRVYVQFKIDSNGNVTEVVARSNDAKLQKEGQRVVSLLPKMKPGRQGNTNVDVMYTVPIVLQLQ